MFKIGDWVVCRDYGGNEEFRKYEDKLNDIFKSVKSWQPKEGEWCWIYRHLCKCIKVESDMYTFYCPTNAETYEIVTNFAGVTQKIEDYCEPFIGKLPSFIKNKK